jgi:Xaa-Pro dipeptidase
VYRPLVSRLRELEIAESLALELLELSVEHGLLSPGQTELTASDGIRNLAEQQFGITHFWHKRIVRSGENTLHPYQVNPPVRTFDTDDILFIDFGPVLKKWEADVGRTYVIGDNPLKCLLRDDTEKIWTLGRDFALTNSNISGAELYSFMKEQAELHGYFLGDQRHVGHLIGEFPHERIENDAAISYLTPSNTQPLNRRDLNGNQWHWILECHLVSPTLGVGGFFEQLLK